MQFATGEDVHAEALLLAGHDELLVFLEVELVGGVYQPVLRTFDEQEDLVVRLQLSV